MTLPARGARPLGRAGSFVAGADDGGALYYNPAGFADIDGVGVLIDAGLVLQQVEYTRTDSGGNVHPTTKAEMGILPIPTIAISYKPKKVPWLTLNGGVWTPYLGLSRYPEMGPQRYSVINLDGSLVLVMQLGAAFRVHEHFWIGFGMGVGSSGIDCFSCSTAAFPTDFFRWAA
jgi:long-subunit fatty acid transport protein